MLEVVEYSDLKEGDTIIIDGDRPNEFCIVTVEELMTDDYLIIPKELGGLDYSPPDLDKIVRVGRKGQDLLLTSKHIDYRFYFNS